MPQGPRVAVVAAVQTEELNIANDPFLSPTLPTSPSHSRVGMSSIAFAGEAPEDPNENDPLLGGEGSKERRKKPFYRPRPLWIVPFAVLASISRGMTIAPRVEVFMQLSCNAVFGHKTNYNHTTRTHELLSISHSINLAANNNSEPILLSIINSNQDGNTDTDNDNDSDGDDPLRVPTKRCLSDPTVQSGAARLQTIMTTTMGLLSALTTGWWGRFGERHGRTRVLAAATLGLLFTDIIFVLVSIPGSPLAAHGHKLLILAPVVEGLLGGWSTLQGATNSYISDCTSDGSRAHIFSRFMGVFYFGFALGPMLGAWVITHPPAILRPLLQLEPASAGRTVAPVFWVAVLFSIMNFLLSVFVFPESLGKKKDDVRPAVTVIDETEEEGTKSANEGPLPALKGLFTPLMVFAPKNRPTGRDWNMTLLALALFGYLLSSGIFQLKYLYAGHVFGWEAEQLSYYITFVGGARAVHLLFFMPLIISYCKPKPKKTLSQQQATINGKKPKPTKAQLAAEMKFDLRITRLSYAIDLLSHTLVSFSSTAPTSAAQAAFVSFTVLSSLGAGVVPSMQSLALCTMQTEAAEDERLGLKKPGEQAAIGSLFGALAVLQATGQMILGPMIFGLVYSTTVARFPKGIFVLAASILAVSIALLSGVHPRHSPAELKKHLRGKKAGHAWDGPEMERGRSRVSKDLTGASGSGSIASNNAATQAGPSYGSM